MHQIQRGIYYEESYLGVTLGGIVFPQGTILIDAPLRAEDARSWRSVLLNQRGNSNRLLVNLDAHPDRTLGARALDCTVVAHQKTAQVFRSRPTIFKGQSMETGSVWETYNDSIGMRWVAPDITFSDNIALYLGGPHIILEHHPGPTPGAVWAVLPSERIVFVGDLITPEQPPFLANADLNAWLEGLDLLLTQMSDYTIVSGRGGLIISKDILAMQRFLKETVKGMDRLSRQNASPEGTEELISSLLSGFAFQPQLRDIYVQRLQYGLAQYYTRRYRPSAALEEPNVEDEEQ